MMFRCRNFGIFGFLKHSSVVRYKSDVCGGSKSSKGSSSTSSPCGSSKGSSNPCSSSKGSSSKGSSSNPCSSSKGSSNNPCGSSKGSGSISPCSSTKGSSSGPCGSSKGSKSPCGSSKGSSSPCGGSTSSSSSSSSGSSTSGDSKSPICPPCPSFYDNRKYGHNLPCDSVQPQFETLPGIPTGIFRCTNGEILGRGADKCCLYPNPEYFSYHHMTFYDIHLCLRPCRQPSPISGRKK